eukprot:3305987-Karenia_brevis.AAC.1
MISRDSLASVDGFRTIVCLFMEHLLGLEFCPSCPNCFCSDLFGSNAKPEGGILGRVDGIYGAVEAQKSAGNLHVHVQVFVQCLHQHEPLQEIFKVHRDKILALKREYMFYKKHVCREEYANVAEWQHARKAETEKSWPHFEASAELISCPNYLRTVEVDPALYTSISYYESLAGVLQNARRWCTEYLFQRAQRGQELRQNHVHIWNERKQMHVPLTHCQSADDPSRCKAFFPRTTWLVDRCVVLCQGLLRARGMPATGKKNLEGSLLGPRNEPMLNGTMPPVLAGCPGLNFNSDLQLPYRFPITEETHEHDLC